MDIIKSFINKITNKRESLVKIVSNFKNSTPYSELCTLVDSSYPILNQHKYLFIGNPLPKSYEELGRIPFLYCSSFDIELNWFMLALRKYTQQIQLFLKLKKEYENALLLSNYSSAENTLTLIEKEICCSLWSLENRLLLSELKGGLSKNKQTLNDLISNKLHYDTQFLAHFYSLRVETEFSLQGFNETITSAFNNYHEEDREILINYFLFKLNPYDGQQEFDFKSILQFEIKFSIIDRYLSFTKLSRFYFSNQLTLESDKNLISRIDQISKKIEDPIIDNLNVLIHSSFKKYSNFSKIETSIVLELKGNFLRGNYDECLNSCLKYLDKYPQNFELMQLTARCILQMDLEITSFIDHNLNIRNSIIYGLFEIYKKRSDSFLFGGLLLKYSYTIESMDLAYKLLAFVGLEVYNDNSAEKLSILSDQHINSKFYKIFNDNETKSTWLEEAIRTFKQNFVFHYYHNIINGMLDINLKMIEGNELRKKFLIANSFLYSKRYDEAIELLNSMQSECGSIGYLLEKVVRKLFIAYISNEKIDQGIQLYIETYLREPELCKRIETSDVINSIRKTKFKSVEPSIYLPIFCFVTDCDETEIMTGIRLYLQSIGLKTPSEIYKSVKDLSSNAKELSHFEFLLYNVCNTDVLKHSSLYRTPKDIYIERINILNTLKATIPENQKKYDEESQLMTKKLIILDGMIRLDESKIYINEEGIYETELKQSEQIYHRLMHLVQAFSENNLLTLEKTQNSIQLQGQPAYLNDLFLNNINLVVPSFKELFNEIKNNFLNSKFGLATYLSTRIRHGVLEASLRPIFEKAHLITQKNSLNDKYIENQHWKSKLNGVISAEKQERFQQLLSEFSRTVDDYIKELLFIKLQIKTEGKNFEGLFDYIFSEPEMQFGIILDDPSKPFKDFVYNVFDILWIRTDSNLKNIRDFIKQQARQKFDNLLNKLEVDSLKFLKKDLIPEFYTNIGMSRTFVEQELEKIANWFLRSNTQMSDFSLSDIIDITYESVSKSYINKKTNLETILNFNPIIKGKYYVHITDLLRLFFDNCLRHAAINNFEIPLSVQSIQDDNFLVIKISNPIPDEINKTDLKTSIDIVCKQMNQLERIGKEGKSGFFKAYKILKSDLDNDLNEIDLNVTDEFKVILRIYINSISNESIDD